MSTEREHCLLRGSESESKKSPILVYDESVLKQSLPYRVEVDPERAGDLLRFLSLSDEVIEGTTIQVTNNMRHVDGDYNHATKTIRIRACSVWNAYKPGISDWRVDPSKKLQALEEANRLLNNILLHEAFHAFDFHINYDYNERRKEDRKKAKKGFIINVGSTMATSMLVGITEALGTRTDIACFDIPFIVFSGAGVFVASRVVIYSRKYLNDPLEIRACEFVEEHEYNPKWTNIVRYSLV